MCCLQMHALSYLAEHLLKAPCGMTKPHCTAQAAAWVAYISFSTLDPNPFPPSLLKVVRPVDFFCSSLLMILLQPNKKEDLWLSLYRFIINPNKRREPGEQSVTLELWSTETLQRLLLYVLTLTLTGRLSLHEHILTHHTRKPLFY